METNGKELSKRESRAALLEKYRVSGLSQKAFCEGEGIALSTLQSWLKKKNRIAAFTEVCRPKELATSVELTFPDGTALRIRSA